LVDWSGAGGFGARAGVDEGCEMIAFPPSAITDRD
jgi:hypothetical protein